MFHISKLKALGMPETGKMKTAVPRISVKLSCRSQSVSETSTGLRGSFAMNENFLGFQLAREEHNASFFFDKLCMTAVWLSRCLKTRPENKPRNHKTKQLRPKGNDIFYHDKINLILFYSEHGYLRYQPSGGTGPARVHGRGEVEWDDWE